MKTVQFTADKRDALRRAYNTAVKAKSETFTFEGNEYLVKYVKYVLEYLDGEFRRQT